jgi:hypothetical protein
MNDEGVCEICGLPMSRHCAVCGELALEDSDLCRACNVMGFIVGDQDPETGELILDRESLALARRLFSFDDVDQKMRAIFDVPELLPNTPLAFRRAYLAALLMRATGVAPSLQAFNNLEN